MIDLDQIKSDLKQAVEEHGETLWAVRKSDSVTAKGCVGFAKRKTTYFQNFIRDVILLSDCGFRQGELLQRESTGDLYLVQALAEKIVLGCVVAYVGELLLVNDRDIRIFRYEKQASKGTVSLAWQLIATMPANVEHVTGGIEHRDQLLLQTTEIRLVVQAASDIRLEDRVEIGGVAYKVEDVNDLLLPGLLIAQLSKDTRR